MAKHDDEDDLFKHTSMSFGEHLEELRSALFKAVIALVIGFAIGLAFGAYIVAWIQDPLKAALETYYQNQAMERVNARFPRICATTRRFAIWSTKTGFCRKSAISRWSKCSMP